MREAVIPGIPFQFKIRILENYFAVASVSVLDRKIVQMS